ncbi:hypothetical protein niasHT_034072 [Heterodera trifolii]|uniref:Uncharacterized protein n=1 Tax=Heterodera trifolii TaxID=157864 RepID=A0ABD2I0F4_9BILA
MRSFVYPQASCDNPCLDSDCPFVNGFQLICANSCCAEPTTTTSTTSTSTSTPTTTSTSTSTSSLHFDFVVNFNIDQHFNLNINKHLDLVVNFDLDQYHSVDDNAKLYRRGGHCAVFLLQDAVRNASKLADTTLQGHVRILLNEQQSVGSGERKFVGRH